jgi:hypothetical protein
MKTRILIIWTMLLVLAPGAINASAPLRRYLLAVGANSGGSERVSLRYAVTDAERFADIMVRMGGVAPADRLVLREPDRNTIETAISNLARRISENAGDGRSEVLFYYSGHADEKGLRIGGDRISYSDLRSSIDVIPATVRITVLDACASGVITRLKGGERRQPFLVDVSSDMEGYAFLTSSSENESAQESDVIGASFFTHYLVSGLRGAADVSGDGRVSLTEAYQFAFDETLARTTETMGGAQHPAYHINLSGTGDVVMTDVRQTTAGLVLAKELQGRFYVRDRDEHLVAELYKPRGRRVVLGLEAGQYEIHLKSDPELFVARVELGLEELFVLNPENFETAERSTTVARGDAGTWPPRPGFMGPLTGRSRVQIVIGKNETGLDAESIDPGFVSAHANYNDLFFGIGYSRWIREDLSVGLDLLVTGGDFQNNVGLAVVTHTTALVSIRVSGRKYGPSSLMKTPVRPFVLLGAGALIGVEEKSEVAGAHVSSSSSTMGAFGGELGLGVDIIVAHRFMLGAKASYFAVTDFPEPLAGKDNYSGLEFSVSFGFLFGRGFEG